MVKALDPNKFRQEMQDKGIEIFNDYETRESEIRFQCKKCKKIDTDIAWNMRRADVPCKRCRGILNEEEFIEWLHENNPDVRLVGEYKNMSTKANFWCDLCDSPFPNPKVPRRFGKGNGCPKCNNKIAGKKRRQKHEDFVKKVNRDNPDIEVLGTYDGTKNSVHVKCKKCNRDWWPQAGSLYGKHPAGCIVCKNREAAIKRTKSVDDFLSQLKEVYLQYELSGKYINMDTKVDFKCQKCKNTFPARPWELLQGHGCPNCRHSATSFAEQFIYYFLKHNLSGTEVLNRNHDLIDKELDIVIPDKKIAIEFGSWYWHKNKVENDYLKRVLCKNIGYKLITIFDDCRGFVEKFDTREDFFKYDYDIGSEYGYPTLKELCETILKDYFSSETNTKFYTEIIKKAHACSCKKSTEDFQDDLDNWLPGYKVIGEYTGNKNHIEVMCPNGHTLDKCTPNNLLNKRKKYSCKYCNLSKKHPRMFTNEQFDNKLSKSNRNVKRLEDYRGANVPIMFECLLCGNPLKEPKKPSWILNQQFGCQDCARKFVGQKNSKKVFCVENGVVYNNADYAAKKLNVSKISIGKICRGEMKSTQNYHFKYV